MGIQTTFARRFAACIAVAGLSGCIFDVAVGDAVIACDDDGTCPDGRRCQQPSNRCIVVDANDDTPPEVSSSSISALYARVGTNIVVTLDVTEPLAAVPVLAFADGDGAAFVNTSASDDATSFGYRHATTGAEPPGPVRVQVQMEDLAGNASADTLAQDITFDFTPPQVTAQGAPSPIASPPGHTVTIAFSVDDGAVGSGIPSPPTAALVDVGGDAPVVTVSALTEGYQAQVALPADMNEGSYLVQVTASDAAGNTIVSDVGSVVVDESPPVIATKQLLVDGDVVDDDSGAVLVPSGRLLRLVLTASEALSADPALEPTFTLHTPAIDTTLVGTTTVSGPFVTFDTPFVASSGSYEIRMSGLTDVAGNAAEASVLFAINVDAEVPEVTQVSSVTSIASDTTLPIVISVSEALANPLALFLGALEGTCALEEGLRYACSIYVDAAVADGSYTLVATLDDQAGNHIEQVVGAIVVDNTVPQPQLSAVVVENDPQANPTSGVLVSSGVLMRVVVDAHEDIGVEPLPKLVLVSHVGEPDAVIADVSSVSGRLAVFNFLLAAPEGAYDVVVDGMADVAGNVAAPTALFVMDVDSTAPRATVTAPPVHLAGLDQVVSVSFSVDEPLAFPPLVALGNAELACVSEAPLAYACAVAVGAGAEEGLQALTVLLQDPAGNTTQQELAAIDVDVTPPALLFALVTPDISNAQTPVVVTVVADELLDEQIAPPLVVNAPYENLFAETGSISGSVMTYIANGSGEDGVPRITAVTLTDRAGNAADVALDLTFTIDTLPPAIQNVSVTPFRASAVEGFSEVTFRFSTGGENLDAAPASIDVRLGTKPFTCEPYDAVNDAYRCSLQVFAPPPPGGPQFDPDLITPEGTFGAALTAFDAAGNVAVAASLVTIDHTPPSLASSTASLTIKRHEGSLAAAPLRVTPGAVAEIGVLTSADTASVLLNAIGPAVVEGLQASSIGPQTNMHNFQVRHGPSFPNGSYTFSATLVDDVGNTATFPLTLPSPGVVVADIAPTPCVIHDANDTPFCTDFDGDGFVGVTSEIAGCGAANPDCDDEDPAVFPGALEIPGDRLDNDCAGDGDADVFVGYFFMVPGTAPSGDGTPGNPFTGSIRDRLAEISGTGKPLLLMRGAYNDQASFPLDGTLIGGFDANWQRNLTDRSTITFSPLSVSPQISMSGAPGTLALVGIDVNATGASSTTTTIVSSAGMQLIDSDIVTSGRIATGNAVTRVIRSKISFTVSSSDPNFPANPAVPITTGTTALASFIASDIIGFGSSGTSAIRGGSVHLNRTRINGALGTVFDPSTTGAAFEMVNSEIGALVDAFPPVRGFRAHKATVAHSTITAQTGGEDFGSGTHALTSFNSAWVAGNVFFENTAMTPVFLGSAFQSPSPTSGACLIKSASTCLAPLPQSSFPSCPAGSPPPCDTSQNTMQSGGAGFSLGLTAFSNARPLQGSVVQGAGTTWDVSDNVSSSVAGDYDGNCRDFDVADIGPYAVPAN